MWLSARSSGPRGQRLRENGRAPALAPAKTAVNIGLSKCSAVARRFVSDSKDVIDGFPGTGQGDAMGGGTGVDGSLWAASRRKVPVKIP